MILRDYHVHTDFSDGKASPEEMAAAALARGMEELGFSDHSHTPFDESYCIAAGRAAEYRARVEALKAQYAGRLRILCGLEQDVYSQPPEQPFDYLVGSAHFVRPRPEVYVPVDVSPEILARAAAHYYDADIYALCEAYFDTAGRVLEQTGADIIGHFDLIAKFQEREPLFNEAHPRYVAAWQKAVDRLLPYGKPFEINTGAMSRGYRTSP